MMGFYNVETAVIQAFKTQETPVRNKIYDVFYKPGETYINQNGEATTEWIKYSTITLSENTDERLYLAELRRYMETHCAFQFVRFEKGEG